MRDGKNLKKFVTHIEEIVKMIMIVLLQFQVEKIHTFNPILLKKGRFGPYLQCGDKMKSLPPGITETNLTKFVLLKILLISGVLKILVYIKVIFIF